MRKKATGGFDVEVHDVEARPTLDETDVVATLVAWELKRPHRCDGRVVESNEVVAYALASNSNAQFLGGEIGFIGLAQYVVGYCAKNPVKLTGVLSVIKHVIQEIDARLGHPPPPPTKFPHCTNG